MQRLMRYHKQGIELLWSKTRKRGRKGMSAVYVSVIGAMISENGGLKPKDGLSRFKNIFPEWKTLKDFPTDKQILSKISSVKQEIRKRNLKSDIQQMS